MSAPKINERPIAALPMYDFPPLEDAHDALWLALRSHLIAEEVVEAPVRLTHRIDPLAIYQHPLLLLGQGCQYPLAKFFAKHVRLVATPRYSVPGCNGATHRSAILVREDDPAHTLADLRNRCCAINERASNTGMNLLRAAIAPIANSAQFFESVVVSGSHRRSIHMIANGEADVAAVDCVSLAHFQRLYPSITASVRVLDWTPAAPSLPFITAAGQSDKVLKRLRSSLAAIIADRDLDETRERLFLEDFDVEPIEDYGAVLQLERSAARLGYPKLF
jgi:ABC-type phosphate/phosphonate transport system substrate-binding protein